ncbi:hypothetical protein BZA77DRAFT_319745 [Pyronema omphalodes]|nr:hypothetical protein BZA77DRAFT_319745 [Pyronema omphalodes]
MQRGIEDMSRDRDWGFYECIYLSFLLCILLVALRMHPSYEATYKSTNAHSAVMCPFVVYCNGCIPPLHTAGIPCGRMDAMNPTYRTQRCLNSYQGGPAL